MTDAMMLAPILSGPTASGKTSVALELADRHGLEIINADSLLVYRGLNIGTAKPTFEQLSKIPHHLIDIREPEESYTAAEFVRDVERILRELQLQQRRALIVGGTPFYLKALTFGLWDAPPTNLEYRQSTEDTPSSKLFAQLELLDPAHASKIGPADRYRIIRALEILQFSGKKPSELEAEARKREPDPRFPLWILDRDSAELDARIHARTHSMLEQGMIDEVRNLQAAHPGARPLSSVGYAQICDYLEQRQPSGRRVRPGLTGLADEIELATRQLVKSQRTFFRGMPHAQWFIFEQDRPKLESLAQAIFAKT